MRSRSNWNLEVLVFKERGKPEYPEKNLSEQRREPTTNSTPIWRRRQDSNLGHIGGRRVLSPLRHPCSPKITNYVKKIVVNGVEVLGRAMVDPAHSRTTEVPVHPEAREETK